MKTRETLIGVPATANDNEEAGSGANWVTEEILLKTLTKCKRFSVKCGLRLTGGGAAGKPAE